MKKIIILLLSIAAITFLGCKDNIEEAILSAPTETNQIAKISSRSSNIYTWLSFSKIIDGSIGGEIEFDTTFINTQGREIYIYGWLRFRSGSFSGITEITVLPNVENLSIQFFPELVFDKKVKLNFEYTGVDVKSFGFNQTGEVEFVYFTENGGIEPVEYELAHVNIHHDEIMVMNASLNHFSRYGWIR